MKKLLISISIPIIIVICGNNTYSQSITNDTIKSDTVIKAPVLPTPKTKNNTSTSKSSSTSTSKSSTTASKQCRALTKKGARCKRTAQAGRSYCWQH